MPAKLDLDAVSSEHLVSREPVIVRRRVRWGECDPAQVVYTPRFADYLADAYFWFVRVVLDEVLTREDGTRISTPMKSLSLDFHHVLKANETFDMVVTVQALHDRTFDLLISARSPEGDPRFDGRVKPILVDKNFRSISLPAEVRSALLAYQQACAQASDC